MKHYKIVHWTGADNAESGIFEHVNCLIDAETIDNLLKSKPPMFIRVIVKDGEQAIIPTENIFEIVEQFTD